MPKIKHAVEDWMIDASDAGWKRADTKIAIYTTGDLLAVVNDEHTTLAMYLISSTKVNVQELHRFTQDNVEDLINWRF